MNEVLSRGGKCEIHPVDFTSDKGLLILLELTHYIIVQ
jgi:hypothetical protein